ncbi:hypothetical protein GCM10027061_14530 [Nesterenkonia suensis]
MTRRGHAVPAPAALATRIRTAEPPQTDAEDEGAAGHGDGEHPSGAADVASKPTPAGHGAAEGEPPLDTGECEVLSRSARRAQDRERRKRRRRRGAVLGVIGAVLVGVVAWYAVTGEDDAARETPVTTGPDLVDSRADLRDECPMRLWDLPPSEAR